MTNMEIRESIKKAAFFIMRLLMLSEFLNQRSVNGLDRRWGWRENRRF